MSFVSKKDLSATNVIIFITLVAYIIQINIQNGSLLMGLNLYFSWWILLATTYINIFSWWNCSPWNEYVCFMAIWKSYRKS